MSNRAKFAVPLLAGLLTTTGGACAVDADAEEGPARVVQEQALAASKRQPAPDEAIYRVKTDGSVKLVVRGSFRSAEVRFRSAQSRTRFRVKASSKGDVKFVLPAGAHRIKARAKATPKRAASVWIRATAAGTPVTPPTADPRPSTGTALTSQDLAAVAGIKTFFGHQSVGGNILKGVPLVYSDFDVKAPQILEEPATLPGAGILHAEVGKNRNPLSKISDFAEAVRGGIGRTFDVALMKFCYVDITDDTDVDALFASYRSVMADLQRENPGVVFIHVTAPLTTDSPADNVKRENYNALVRKQYADSGRLFDLAAIESTRPDGTRVSGSYQGRTYYSLYEGYASDNGHLNAQGAKAAASRMLDVIAQNAG